MTDFVVFVGIIIAGSGSVIALMLLLSTFIDGDDFCD